MSEPSQLSDPKRVRAVNESGLLNSIAEADFDQLTRLAARLLNAPTALVTVISEDRQFIKSAENGSPPYVAGASQTLDMSFCKYAVASNAPLIIEDARDHELVRNSNAIAAGVIAYAGIPLETQSGDAIGALCVVDSKPRQWSDEEIENLHVLARSTMKLMDERANRAVTQPAIDENAPIKTVLDCLTLHLRSLDAYSALLRASGAVDLDEEERIRNEVTDSFQSMRHIFERSTNLKPSDEEDAALLKAVAAYIAASDRREQAARAFAEGEFDLSMLESSISMQMETADALRVTAVHRGIEL
jgi:signal transduction protein with GAF and PtsI domain